MHFLWAIPKFISEKRVFYILGKQTDWGPHTNGNLRFFLTDADFDETWLKAVLGMLDYGSIIQKPFIQKLWQPCHSQTFS